MTEVMPFKEFKEPLLDALRSEKIPAKEKQRLVRKMYLIGKRAKEFQVYFFEIRNEVEVVRPVLKWYSKAVEEIEKATSAVKETEATLSALRTMIAGTKPTRDFSDTSDIALILYQFRQAAEGLEFAQSLATMWERIHIDTIPRPQMNKTERKRFKELNFTQSSFFRESSAAGDPLFKRMQPRLCRTWASNEWKKAIADAGIENDDKAAELLLIANAIGRVDGFDSITCPECKKIGCTEHSDESFDFLDSVQSIRRNFYPRRKTAKQK